MLGWIQYEKMGEARIERRWFGDTAVLAVRVPRGKGLRSLFAAHRAAQLMARRRVRLAAFPAGYPYTDTFLHREITPSNITQLHLGCASQIALSALRQRGIAAENANVALISGKMCRELHGTAHSLARTVRYLTLRTPDADALAHVLRREYGIAAKVLRESDAIRADLALSFDAAREGCIALSDAHLETTYSSVLDGETCTDAPLLAALLSTGALRTQDIRLEHLILHPTANFP